MTSMSIQSGRGVLPGPIPLAVAYAATFWPWQVGHVCQSYRYVRRPVATVPMTVPFPAQSGHAAGAGLSGSRSIQPSADMKAA